MGLLSTAAKAAVASSVHGRVQRRQQEKWGSQDAPPTMSGAVGDPGSANIAHQLALIGQLNDLRLAGALTDAEFEAKKAQILGI